MFKLLLTPRAIADLEEIYEYSFYKWGLEQAEKYHDELHDFMLSIARNPQIGSVYYHKQGDYRILHSNRHLIFYKLNKETCIIVRLLHERMDLKTQLE